MKHNRLLFLFSVATVSSLILRTLQIYFSVDQESGFFKKEYTPEAQYILVVIFLFAFSLFLFCLKSHRAPLSPPQNSVLLSIPSGLAAVSVLLEFFSLKAFVHIPFWQILGFAISALFCAAFLILLAASQIFGTPFPASLSVFPTIYLVFKMIYEFTSVSALALISDNLLLHLSLAAAMLFMLNLTKLYTGCAKENGFRHLLGWGLCSSLLCLTQSLPHFIVQIIKGASYSHISFATNLNLFFLGLFILFFVLVHFSKENANK